MQLATFEIGQFAMQLMVSSAQMFSHFSARSIELKIHYLYFESTVIRYSKFVCYDDNSMPNKHFRSIFESFMPSAGSEDRLSEFMD